MTTKSSKQTPIDATKTVEGVMAAGQEAMQTFVKASTEGYEKVFEGAKVKAEDFVKGYDEFAVTGKDNVEAVVAASTAYTKGMEAIAGEWMAFTKSAMEQNMTNAKAVMGAKTMQEMMDLQAGFAKSSFDGFVAQSTKVSEMAAKVAQDTLEPINARVTTAMGKMSNAA
tara:strand:+ start:619 stop:1125 length:507 start_codon:yes stop_codon:yes gene_type:complete